MILADTSIWVDLFRKGRFQAELNGLAVNNQLCTHPYVVAELACGLRLMMTRNSQEPWLLTRTPEPEGFRRICVIRRIVEVSVVRIAWNPSLLRAQLTAPAEVSGVIAAPEGRQQGRLHANCIS